MTKIAIIKTADDKIGIVHPMSVAIETAVTKLPTTTAYFIIDKSQLDMDLPHPHIDTAQFDWSAPDGYGEQEPPTEPAQ